MRPRLTDVITIIGAALVAVLVVISLVVSIQTERGNHTLLQENHALTEQNHQLVLQSNRNHATDLQVQQEIGVLCHKYIPACPLP